MKSKDPQKKGVYASQHALDRILHEDAFVDFPETVKYIDIVQYDPWFIERWGRLYINVFQGNGSKIAYAKPNDYYHKDRRIRTVDITLPVWYRARQWILEEIAHGCMDGDPYSKEDHHGPRFCGVLLALVGHFMGRRAMRLLKAEFIKNDVKWIQYRRCK